MSVLDCPPTLQAPPLTNEQRRALDILRAADTLASPLRTFATAETILSGVDDNDQFHWVVTDLARRFFGGDVDFNEAMKSHGVSRTASGDLEDLFMQERGAVLYAAFALGVAWASTEKGSRR